MIAALIVATAAKAGFGSRAALPEMNTTAPCSLQRLPGSDGGSSRTVRLQCCTVFPLLVGHLEQIDLRNSACDVYQTVDSAETVKCAIDQGLGRKRLPQIEGATQRVGARRFYTVRGLVKFGLPASPPGQRLGIARATYRGRAADALPRAGNDGDGFSWHFIPSKSPLRSERRPCGFQNHADHNCGRCIHRTVVHIVCPDRRAHPLSHKPLCLGRSCLILDLELPDINGLEVHQQLSGTDGTPIVFVTGHGDVPSSVRAMKSGAVEFLLKPVRKQELLKAITAGLELDRVARAARFTLAELRKGYDVLTPENRKSFRSSSRALRTNKPLPNLGTAGSQWRFSADKSCARWERDRSRN